MEMGYKIGRVSIRNFKSIKKLDLDLRADDLSVLDGPNGFGKTTVFDAIELALVGRINRITEVNKGAPIQRGAEGNREDNYLRIGTQPLYIFLELTSGEDSSPIVIGLKRVKSNYKKELRAENFGGFKRILLKSIPNSDVEIAAIEFEKAGSIDQNDLEAQIGLTRPLVRFFNLFYFIQQEEPAFFLKQPEKSRAETISILFDTKRETDELAKIQGRIDAVNQLSTDVSTKVQAKQLERKVLEDVLSGVAKMEDRTFLGIRIDKPIAEWDRQSPFSKIPIDQLQNRYAGWRQEIEKIQVLVEKKIDYISARNSKAKTDEINNWLQQRKELEDVMKAGFFLDRIEEFKLKLNIQKRLIALRNRLDRVAFEEKFAEIDWAKELDEVVTKIELDSFLAKISALAALKNSQGEVGAIINAITTTRKPFYDSFTLAINKKREKSIPIELLANECPMCGHDWETQKQLDDAIATRLLVITKLNSETGKRVVEFTNQLFADDIARILDAISTKLGPSEQFVSADFVAEISLTPARIGTVRKFILFCETNQLSIQGLWNSAPNVPIRDGVLAKVTDVVSLLEGALKQYDEPILSQGIEIRNMIGEEPFEYLLENGKVESLKQKVEYLRSEYRKQADSSFTKVVLELETLEKQSGSLISLRDKLDRIRVITSDSIKEHNRKLISEIEIPFYIYSGKILQDVQRGSGLFIYNGEGFSTELIRFQATPETDQDAYFNLSSGQLAALVLAFTLTLNKKYGSEGLRSVMIDDPIQTMDEINMASFVDLIRYEFPEHQVIISTHEPSFSTYIRFRFLEIGRTATSVNLKTIQYLSEAV